MYSSITISELRRRIRSLKRRLALPLAIVRITPLADDFAAQCSVAYFDHKPWPDFMSLGRAICREGYPYGAYNHLYRYLRGCQQRRQIPKPAIIVATLLSPDIPYACGPAYEKHYEWVWNAAGSVTDF